MIRGQKHQFS